MGADCRLHPLIHTLAQFNLAQDVDFSQGKEKKTPATHGQIVTGDSSKQGEETLQPYSRIALSEDHWGVSRSGLGPVSNDCIIANL